jgi:hypothetical protein
VAFEGFPAETFGFYERLEADNSKGSGMLITPTT